MNQLYNGRNTAISIWLGLMCFAVIIMIFIGGLTRLTEAGLSITEWRPVSGIIPPTDNSSWNIEFDKYKQSPEYIKRNIGMALEEFKSIYLLEFTHRIAGRVISLLYILPLMVFFVMGSLRGRDTGIYIVALLLLAMQGVMGWYMVKSGLVSNPYVSHYRLAAHLMFAVFLYMIMFWQFMKYSFDIMLVPTETKFCRASCWCIVSIILLLMQIMFGAFVAGLDAGLVYNSFPLMGENFIPYELTETGVSFASWGEPVFVQFVHRIAAYMLFVVICIFCVQALRFHNRKLSRVVLYVFLALVLQISLGVVTLIYNVPIALALLHQFGAMLLLSCLLWAFFLIKSSRGN
ncbi:MAG: COX15/CtaA family protein [Rickettsiaceae bacterium]|nr:COX15/CtaA family protein [Rickettsiaceae bacterium]MDP5083637.1 COX15/CtaA family protein [Rickettsiaceae bacterium]